MKKIILLFILGISILTVHSQETHEQKMATIIYGFCRLIQWPDYPNNSIQINVYKESSVTDYLNYLSNKNQLPHKVVTNNVEYPTYCHIFFVPSAYFQDFLTKESILAGKPILIVSDYPNSIENNNIDVEFTYVIKNDNDKFLSYKINLNKIKSKSIKVCPEFIGYSQM